MSGINAFLAKYMGYIISFFCELFGNNYALAIFLFTLFINIVFCPINIKQQKSAAKQARIKYKLEKLKEKYADDKAKYQEEMGKLYQESGSSPFSGCLLLFLRLPFFFGIYYAVLSPLTYLAHANTGLIEQAVKALGIDATKVRAPELSLLNRMDELVGIDSKFEALRCNINFDFFGINLTETPEFTWNFSQAQLVWLIPVLSFATAMISSLISTKMQKLNNPDAPSMGGMLLLMPFISLWIAFSVPGAVGFYWACSNLVSMLIQVVMQWLYNPARVIATTEASEARARREMEKKKISAINGDN